MGRRCLSFIIVFLCAVIIHAREEETYRPTQPEYYGAKGDGIDYYRWPLRCFNGFVDNVADAGHSRLTVSYPSEYLVGAGKWKFFPEVTVTSVVFDRSRGQFMLMRNGKYYSSWANSQEWNAGRSPRTDCVFTHLKLSDSYVMREGRMVNIDSTMTDDYPALVKCIRVNGGNVELSDKIYYCKVTTLTFSQSPWYKCDDFCFNGNGGTLFVRSEVGPKKGGAAFAWMWKCTNGEVRNVNVVALRDRISTGVAPGHLFSASSSRMGAFGCYGCRELTFRNVHFLNMSQDFDVKYTTNSGDNIGISIIGWTSKGVLNNSFGATQRLRIDSADVEQYGVIGGDCHLIYGLGRLRGAEITNSHFRQGGDYTEVLLTYHGGTKSEATRNDDINYRNCVIEAARWVQGGGGMTQRYYNCKFVQNTDKLVTVNTGEMYTVGCAIYGANTNLEFYDCDFKLKASYLILHGQESSAVRTARFERCHVDAQTAKDLFQKTPQNKLVIKNCKLHSKGKLGVSRGSNVEIVNTTYNGRRL